MNVIYKYALSPVGKTEIMVSKDAIILSLQEQKNCPTVWMLVDTEKEQERRVINVRVTGEHFKRVDNYIGTVLLYGGTYVAHFFEEEMHA